MSQILRIILSTALFVAICASYAFAQDSESFPVFDTTDAPAFVEFDSSRMVIKDYNNAEFRRHTRIRILREPGIEQAEVAFAQDKFRKVTAFNGRLISANGSVILKRDLDDLTKVCGYGGEFTLFSDICFFHTNLSGGTFPLTIDFEYSLQIKSLFAWHDWEPQRDMPVLFANYVLEIPDEVTYLSREFNFDGSKDEGRTRDGASRRIEWKMTHILPDDLDDCSPPPFDLSPRVSFTPQRAKLGEYLLDPTSWTSLASSYARLYAGCYTLQPEAINEATALISFSADGKPKLESFHRAMMSRLRYVGIYLGIGGWQPHEAQSTYRNQYGDCKDLTTLYIAMLAQAGIRAYPALLRTRDEGHLHKEFVSLSPFNHAIVMMLTNNDTSWIDPTCGTCAIGDLPGSDEGVLALVLDPAGGGLVSTPGSSPEDNVMSKRSRLTIAENLSAQLETEITAIGNPGAQLLSYCREVESNEFERALDWIGALPDNAKAVESQSDRKDSSLSFFSCSAKANVPKAARRIGSKAYVDIGDFVWEGSCDNLELNDRTDPVDLRRNSLFCDTLEITIPPTWTISSAPSGDTLLSDFGSTTISVNQSEGKVTVALTQVLPPRLVQPEDFPKLLEYQKARRELSGAKIVFETK